jgi:voltage-dependent potassium channel beta subunit
MEYRRLGSAGIKVSALSLGSWVTYSTQVDIAAAAGMMAAAYDKGVNFFDNAEMYAAGKSEEIMGAALKKLGWRRASYLVSTKLYWGLNEGPNEKNTLNRKYLMQGIDGSLKRLDMDFVDLLFCHRPDPDTPMEEVVWAMNDIVASGKALYWGTSEWSAEQIRQAWEIADRRNLRKPQMEQPQYSLLDRDKVENDYKRLYADIGLGLTTWSPLASGVLSGKYAQGIPADSRLALPGYEWLKKHFSADVLKSAAALGPIAKDLGGTPSQLAIAWCVRNPHVSTVITGASRLSQLEENLGALDLVPKLSPEVLARIDAAMEPAREGMRSAD